MNQDSKNRDFYRAQASLGVYYGPDTPQARQAVGLEAGIWHAYTSLEQKARHIMEQETGPQELGSLWEVLRWLDYKLDLVLYHLRRKEQLIHFPHQANTFDISGGGVSLLETGDLAQGESILILLPLPDSPSRPVYAVGLVVWLQPQAGPAEPRAGIGFVQISEVDQERIVRFTFEQQRRQLAERGEQEEPG